MSVRIDYTGVAPAGVKALGGVYGYVMESGLDETLVETVYLRVHRSTVAPTASIYTRVI
jgi:hypothetical protein